jgi:hypothetical protein
MFSITDHKGFHMTFANGWLISVQWGQGNYADPRNFDEPWDAPRQMNRYSKSSAEIAVINPKGNLVPLKGESDSVKGYCSADEVARLIGIVATDPNSLVEPEAA